jgi:hypothetical protein
VYNFHCQFYKSILYHLIVPTLVAGKDAECGCHMVELPPKGRNEKCFIVNLEKSS